MIEPHGGKLINRIVSEQEKKRLKDKIFVMKSIKLNRRQVSDLEMIAIGAFSPLEGFMGKNDYENVLHNMRLSNNLVWPIPITLAVDKDQVKRFEIGEDISLLDEFGKVVGILHLKEVYSYDKELEAEKIYRTKDEKHPGVKAVYSQGDTLLGGEVTLLEKPKHIEFNKYYLTPQETRNIFKERGWKTVVGFQTRNPIHRAHEYIQKCALEIYDGLFLHPIVGETKSDDIPAEIRMRCYEVLIENYYPKERVVLSINPAYMRYAGPREAIFHAIVRKNYGCTHFIVGRDHAGVGNYYGPYDAQKIFLEFKPEELGIIPLFFENAFYCKKCSSMATLKTCPHSKEEWIFLSGTKVREMLQGEEIPPLEFTRPEVAKILIEGIKQKRVDYNI
ncbi:MAG: sulfate adenylyltransferase [Candidatus Omnitrophica bacterium]|nr:sulfate adenylyltransferase [Candidatus Omnitrophota bacterium]MCM8809613.1 sulfate adenylyltransferase [Candidatus Omnitrophota bacterium]MCM8810092.1 sulfate adenylyltransferase [Candidatus Omnitrophota bacterium]